MYRRPSSLLPFLILLCSVLASGQSPADAAISGNAYTNYFFRFRYEFTASWIPLSKASKEQVHEFTLDRFPTSCLHPDADATTAGAQDLLTLLRKLPRSFQGNERYAAILAVAEKLPPDGTVRNGTECAAALSEYLQKTGYSLVGGQSELQIGGTSFSRQDLKGTTRSGALYQSLMYTTLRGYAVGFIVIAPNEEVLTATVNAVKRFNFF